MGKGAGKGESKADVAGAAYVVLPLMVTVGGGLLAFVGLSLLLWLTGSSGAPAGCADVLAYLSAQRNHYGLFALGGVAVALTASGIVFLKPSGRAAEK